MNSPIRAVLVVLSLLTFGSSALAQQDIARGKTAYEANCAACHTVIPGKHGFGPSLAGVVGREAGTVEGYKFTSALATSGLHWDAKNLDEFLTNTTAKVPGTAMDLAVPNPADRAAIIAYLGTIKDPTATAAKPAAAPAVAAMPRGGGPTQAELLGAQSNNRDWLYATHDYTGARYVDLAQINTKNAASLRPICIYRSDIPGPTQANPIVYKGVIYVTVEKYTAAIDGKTCRAKWTHKWKADGREISLANRGVAIKDGILVRGQTDGNLIALDMEKGTLLWSRKIANGDNGQYMSMPPLIFEDLVIYGPAGADWGAKNWIGAFKLTTGEQVWKFNLIPDANEPGAETWKDPKSLEHGGASLWTPVSLDVKTGTLYVPAGNPAPDFYGDLRPGDNLYTNSVVALDVRTGKLKWYKQFGPADVWDGDLDQVSPLFSANVKGKKRDLITVSGKDGLMRVLDRDTQEMLFEVPVTRRENIDAKPTVPGVHRCPGLLGGIEYNGPAYNPKTQTLFTGANDWCGMFTLSGTAPTWAVQTHYYGGGVTPDSADQSKGILMAFDAISGKVKWKKEWAHSWSSALTTTSGGVIFTGAYDNDFLVLDQANGEVLYRFNTGGSMGGGVVTYQVDGKQYVAAASGVISGFHGGSGTSALVIFALH